MADFLEQTGLLCFPLLSCISCTLSWEPQAPLLTENVKIQMQTRVALPEMKLCTLSKTELVSEPDLSGTDKLKGLISKFFSQQLQKVQYLFQITRI